MTVGSSNDGPGGGDADWNNDFIAAGSSWINPYIDSDTPGNHEKPEVVAPGDNIVSIVQNGVPASASGTSLAAPQVAGAAALLIGRNPALKNWPEALKAIFMATATNNVDGPLGITTGTDLKDGAGSINVDLADKVASNRGTTSPCPGPCWWADTITASSFDASGYRKYYFNANAGDRIRVAIAWLLDVSCGIIISSSIECDWDELLTNLNLRVSRLSDNATLTNSTSAATNQ